MIPSFICRIILVLAALTLGSTVAQGQSTVGKTTLGQSQNDGRDLANSLIPGKPRSVGKGEKKEEVDPRKLPSKAIHDPTFGGSLVEMGLGSSGDPDVHLQKPRTAPNQDSNAPKPTDAGNDRDSKVSKSTEAGDGQNKDQKATSAAADEKTSEKEKASTSKPDGNR